MKPHIAEKHPEVTDEHISHGLEGWFLAGDHVNTNENKERQYLAWVPDREKIIRIVTPPMGDGYRVISAFFDTRSTVKWRQGNMSYFQVRYVDLEIRE